MNADNPPPLLTAQKHDSLRIDRELMSSVKQQWCRCARCTTEAQHTIGPKAPQTSFSSLNRPQLAPHCRLYTGGEARAVRLTGYRLTCWGQSTLASSSAMASAFGSAWPAKIFVIDRCDSSLASQPCTTNRRTVHIVLFTWAISTSEHGQPERTAKAAERGLHGCYQRQNPQPGQHQRTVERAERARHGSKRRGMKSSRHCCASSPVMGIVIHVPEECLYVCIGDGSQ